MNLFCVLDLCIGEFTMQRFNSRYSIHILRAPTATIPLEKGLTVHYLVFSDGT